MYQNIINNDLGIVLSQLQLSIKFNISKSSFADFDYQSSFLFQLSKKENFEEIKNNIISKLLSTGHYQDVQVTGKGFLSFKVNPLSYLPHENHNPQHIIVDYCGVNVAKQMHIGHIRSMFIGDYIANSHEFIGDKVTRINHIGDWGNQFGFLLLYILNNNLPIENNKQLTSYYKKAYELYQNDNSFANDATNAVKLLQNKEEPFYSMWKKCCDISIQEMNKTTKTFNLSISDKDIQGESFYAEHLPFIENMLIEKGVAYLQDDNTLIVNFNNLPTLLLKKSSGSYLYAMYDIAAIYWRIHNLNADKIVYVVDKRQELHFKQVFAVAHLMGWDTSCKLEHIGFGFILDKEGKPLKTKSGKSLYLDELIAEGFKEISSYSYYEKLDGLYKNTVIDNTLYGALKFFDLHSNLKTDYQFDWDNILNPKGGTAPYVHNAFVRIDSILFKNSIQSVDDELAKIKNFDYSTLTEDGINLFKESIKSLETIYTTMNDYSCHILEESILDLCKKFHHFYENENINLSNNKDNQLALIIFVKHSIEKICGLLGVELYLSETHFQAKLQSKKQFKVS